jgi:transposase
MTVLSGRALPMGDEQRTALEEMAQSTTLPPRRVRQARALLWAGRGVPSVRIAERLGTSPDTVRRWRRRFAEEGVATVGVVAPGRGRKPSLPADTVAEVVRLTVEEPAGDDAGRWTTRRLADRMGVGKDTVARIWRRHDLRPWQPAPDIDLRDEPIDLRDEPIDRQPLSSGPARSTVMRITERRSSTIARR